MAAAMGPADAELLQCYKRAVSALMPCEATAVEQARLRGQLQAEEGEREVALMALHRLQKVVEGYQQRLQIALATPDIDTAAKYVEDLMQKLGSEVQTACEGRGDTSSHGQASLLSPPGSPFKLTSFQAVRQSLEETQRRCETLGAEMTRLTEANNSLMETLGVTTNENKLLLIKIQAQSGEIAALTQQRFSDGERSQQLLQQRGLEQEAARQASLSRADAASSEAAKRCGQLRGRLAERLRRTEARGSLLQNDALRLQQELNERRQDAELLMAEFRKRLETAADDILARVLPVLEKQAQQAAQLRETVAESTLVRRREREAHAEESLAWSLKHGSLATDREDVQARMARECSQLKAQLQAAERARQADQQAWAEERSALEQQLDEQQKQNRAQEAALEQLRRETTRVEGSVSPAGAELEGLEQSLAELQRRAREADDALAAAVGGNEHLRAQIEEQKARFQAKNEAELNECRIFHERRLAATKLIQESEDAMSRKELEALELQSQALAGEVDNLRAREAALAEACQGLERDAASWRAQCETANGLREHHEKEFNEAKRQFQDSRLQVQAASQSLADRVAELEEEVGCLGGELGNKRRQVVTSTANRSARIAAEESLLQQSEGLLQEAKARRQEVDEQRSRMEIEARVEQDRFKAGCKVSETHIAEFLPSSREAVCHLVERLANEKGAVQKIREDLDCERRSILQDLHRAQFESHTELTDAVVQKTRIEEACHAGLAQAARQLEQQRLHMEALRCELTRVQGLLQGTEAALAQAKQDSVKSKQLEELELKWHRESVHQIVTNLELARNEERALEEQIGIQSRKRPEGPPPRGGADAGAGDPRLWQLR